MNNVIKNITTLLFLSVISSASAAVNDSETTSASPRASVTWSDVNKFTDVRPTLQNRKSYQSHVMTAFNAHWGRLAETLPQGYKLQVEMLDIDLAGDVNPLFNYQQSDIRVVTENYFPRMTFNYKVFDANQTVVLSGDNVKVKDMSFLNNTSRRGAQFGMPANVRNGSEFSYDFAMLSSWFKKTVYTPLHPAT